MKKISAGFTLVEIIVVVSIVAILSAIIYANFSQGSAQSRDAKRKSDLRNLQTAIELYKTENGRYPAGCNGVNIWSGHSGSHACAAGSQYIVDLAPKYIKTLPRDPKLNGVESGYMYLTNANGTVYKLVAWKTVESETLNYDSEFKACDVVLDGANAFDPVVAWAVCGPHAPEYITDTAESNKCAFAICNVVNQHGTCNKVISDYIDLNHYDDCKLANINNSYAVWGGYGSPDDVNSNNNNEMEIECVTEKIICEMP
jgi:prepilin-type N-terminal cleavage/methylation domain-containing protein